MNQDFNNYEEYELYEHKRSDKVKWVISFILIVVLLIGLIGAWILLLKPEETPPEEPPEEPPAVTDENGNELESGEVHELPKAMTFRTAMSLAADTGEQSYASVQLHATIKPDEADNKQVDWSVEFNNPTSAWADGKDIDDYMSLTPDSDGSTTATVKCLKDFGEQIKITVTSRDNPEATADCIVDFAKRLVSVSFTWGETSFSTEDSSVESPVDLTTNTQINMQPQYTAYTVDGDMTYEAEILFNETYNTFPAFSATGAKGLTTPKRIGTSFAFIDFLVSAETSVSLNQTQIAAVNNVFKSYGSTRFFIIKVYTTGQTPSLEKEISIQFPSSLFAVKVESIELQDSLTI